MLRFLQNARCGAEMGVYFAALETSPGPCANIDLGGAGARGLLRSTCSMGVYFADTGYQNALKHGRKAHSCPLVFARKHSIHVPICVNASARLRETSHARACCRTHASVFAKLARRADLHTDVCARTHASAIKIRKFVRRPSPTFAPASEAPRAQRVLLRNTSGARALPRARADSALLCPSVCAQM